MGKTAKGIGISRHIQGQSRKLKKENHSWQTELHATRNTISGFIILSWININSNRANPNQYLLPGLDEVC
jgi:hypothetical protein